MPQYYRIGGQIVSQETSGDLWAKGLGNLGTTLSSALLNKQMKKLDQEEKLKQLMAIMGLSDIKSGRVEDVTNAPHGTLATPESSPNFFGYAPNDKPVYRQGPDPGLETTNIKDNIKYQQPAGPTSFGYTRPDMKKADQVYSAQRDYMGTGRNVIPQGELKRVAGEQLQPFQDVLSNSESSNVDIIKALQSALIKTKPQDLGGQGKLALALNAAKTADVSVSKKTKVKAIQSAVLNMSGDKAKRYILQQQAEGNLTSTEANSLNKVVRDKIIYEIIDKAKAENMPLETLYQELMLREIKPETYGVFLTGE